jgi:hypothetical protein
MPNITQLFRESMNACRSVTMPPFFDWRVDARQTDDSLHRLLANGHRDRLFASIPYPELPSCQTSVHTEFDIVGRLADFVLESATPENHQAALLRTCLPQLSFDVGDFRAL